ncbi:unnamed protein product, partial [Hermetia illucens]
TQNRLQLHKFSAGRDRAKTTSAGSHGQLQNMLQRR